MRQASKGVPLRVIVGLRTQWPGGVLRRTVFSALLVLLMFSSAQAPGPAHAVQSRGDDGLREVTAAALWQAADHSRDRRAVARLLQQAIRGAGNLCAWVSDYQIIEHSANRLLFKAKCPGMPPYGVRIERGERLRMQVVGGDGLVGPFSPADGEIISFDQPPSEGIFAGEENRQPPEETNRPRWWILLSSTVNLLLLAAVIVTVVIVARRAKPLPPLESAQKNALMLESREVLPNIYRHPDGFYIVRGRHGRRRIFPWLISALLYRDLGIRFLEHRAFHFSGSRRKD